MSAWGEKASENFRECDKCGKVWHTSEFEEGTYTQVHARCPDCNGKLCWLYYGPLEVIQHYWRIKPAVDRYLASI